MILNYSSTTEIVCIRLTSTYSKIFFFFLNLGYTLCLVYSIDIDTSFVVLYERGFGRIWKTFFIRRRTNENYSTTAHTHRHSHALSHLFVIPCFLFNSCVRLIRSFFGCCLSLLFYDHCQATSPFQQINQLNYDSGFWMSIIRFLFCVLLLYFCVHKNTFSPFLFTRSLSF